MSRCAQFIEVMRHNRSGLRPIMEHWRGFPGICCKTERIAAKLSRRTVKHVSGFEFPMIANENFKRADELTDSQVRCLRLVGQGMSSKEIALETGLSPRTVDQYVNRAAMTLGATSRREAARILTSVESDLSKKLQLQSQGLAVPVDGGRVSSSGSEQSVPESAPHISRWLPPLGGKRHDLKPSETLGEIVKAALIAAIAFGSIVAAGAWLQSLFA
jgi:DNA-binding CsgD family transcriptional regulator